MNSISGKLKAAPFADPNRYGRSDTSAMGRWFWEIDKVLLLLVSVLIGIGLIAVAAASPAAADRYSGGSVRFSELHYFYRQILWIGLGIPVMIGISMLPRERARRLSLFGAAFFFVMLIFVPVLGPEVNGAQRWINFGLGQVQPSEFLKPFYVVAMAWLLSLRETDKSLPVFTFAAGLTGAVAVLLMQQPDFGSTIIFGCVFIAMLALAGVNFRILLGLGVAAILGVILAYFFYDVATSRIDGFLFGEGDNFQTENAMRTLTAGGLFGMGPGGGTRKFGLPEAHTDYIFSVIGEEFGLIACFAIALLYLGIVARVLIKLLDEDNSFAILAGAGLVIQFGLQALINMAVNVQIAPSKGMTLPFISYGGSSMLALSIGMGLLLAFTRRNPYLSRSPYVVKWSGGIVARMNFTLAAGGTGGHMVPAHALAAELKARGHGVMLITDDRGARFPGLFQDVPVHILPAGRLGGGPIGWLKAARSVMRGRAEAKSLYRDHQPDAVVGFGGYPAFPALLAASARGIPTVLHEQNAVIGRVNRLLASDAKAIATAFSQVERLKSRHKSKTVLVGNPVREAIAKLGETPFPAFDDYAPLKLLVTGGSQGATILGQVVPEGLALLGQSLRHRLQLVQQCRPDDIGQICARYAELGIPAEVLTYIEDMDARLGDAHLFIGRSGASTCAELSAAGRPAILIPFAAATDDHQTANARELTNAGGARCIAQDRFTPDVLARQIEALAADPQALANAASRALSVGRPHAARDLADLVERIGQGLTPVAVGPVANPIPTRGFTAQGVPA